MNISQLERHIIEPTLKEVGLYSPAAVKLLLGTVAQESNGRYIRQLGGGPALGLFQMEPETHDDIWANYVVYRHDLKKALISNMVSKVPNSEELVWNLKYATLMARIHYLRVTTPLPDPNDVEGLARYWKVYYNTIKGKGSSQEFIKNYNKYVLGGN